MFNVVPVSPNVAVDVLVDVGVTVQDTAVLWLAW